MGGGSTKAAGLIGGPAASRCGQGASAAEPGDVSLLIMKLNGLPPAGMHDRAFDIDANGGAEPGDVQVLINILNGLPVP